MSNKGRNWTGIVTSLLSVAYVVGLGAYWYLRGTPAQDWKTIPVGEFADLLAGIFAPLAFLWLVAAVFIQSKELALQRLELSETRAVNQEQADAAKDQAAFIKLQADTLSKQLDIANRAQIDPIFEARWNVLIERLHYLQESRYSYNFKSEEYSYSYNTTFGRSGLHSPIDFYQFIYDLDKRLDRNAIIGNIQLLPMQDIRESLANLVEIAPQSSLAMQEKARANVISEMCEITSAVIEKIEYLHQNPPMPSDDQLTGDGRKRHDVGFRTARREVSGASSDSPSENASD